MELKSETGATIQEEPGVKALFYSGSHSGSVIVWFKRCDELQSKSCQVYKSIAM